MALFHYSSIFHLLVNSLVTSSNLSRTWKIPSSSSVSEPLHSFSLATEVSGTGCTITGTSATVSNKQESSSLLKKNKKFKNYFLVSYTKLFKTSKQWEQRGASKVANVRSWTMATKVYLSLEQAVLM